VPVQAFGPHSAALNRDGSVIVFTQPQARVRGPENLAPLEPWCTISSGGKDHEAIRDEKAIPLDEIFHR
jgi:hypothetical protein